MHTGTRAVSYKNGVPIIRFILASLFLMRVHILATSAILSFLSLCYVVNNVYVGGKNGVCLSLSGIDRSLSYFGCRQDPPISVDTNLCKSYQPMSFLSVFPLAIPSRHFSPLSQAIRLGV